MSARKPYHPTCNPAPDTHGMIMAALAARGGAALRRDIFEDTRALPGMRLHVPIRSRIAAMVAAGELERYGSPAERGYRVVGQ